MDLMNINNGSCAGVAHPPKQLLSKSRLDVNLSNVVGDIRDHSHARSSINVTHMKVIRTLNVLHQLTAGKQRNIGRSDVMNVIFEGELVVWVGVLVTVDEKRFVGET
ncbi:MAG: hypothetical protein V3S09_00150 [Candidatus Bathyarchaeia archaeon]